MSNQKDQRSLLMGVAVAAGILGTLTTIFISKKQEEKNWGEKTQDFFGEILDGTDHLVNKKMVWGGMAGGALGALAALLFTPKSGEDLIKDLSSVFRYSRHVARKTVAKRRKQAQQGKRGNGQQGQAKKVVKSSHLTQSRPHSSKKKHFGHKKNGGRASHVKQEHGQHAKREHAHASSQHKKSHASGDHQKEEKKSEDK